MKQPSEAYWTARLAPYVLTLALIGVGISLYWTNPPFGFLAIATFSGALVFLFHSLRWRTNRSLFQVPAIVSAFVPLFVAISRLHGVEVFQYLATFVASYMISVLIFRNQLSKALNHEV